jgi:hypothetical protein
MEMFSPIFATSSLSRSWTDQIGILHVFLFQQADLGKIFLNLADHHLFDNLLRLARLQGLVDVDVLLPLQHSAGTSSRLTATGLTAAMCMAMFLAKALKSSVLATKSVSQPTSTITPKFAAGVDVGFNHTFLGLAPSPFGCHRQTLSAAADPRPFPYRRGLRQGLLAVHHAGVGFIAKFFDHLACDIHVRSPC